MMPRRSGDVIDVQRAGDGDLPGHRRANRRGARLATAGDVSVAKEWDDPGGHRRPLLAGALEEKSLGGEQHIGDMPGLTVDTELVAQLAVERSNEADDRAPQLRRQQTVAALATALEEVDERIGFAEQQARAPDTRATPDSVAVDATQLEHRALDGSRELPAEDAFLRGSGQTPGKGCVLHRRIVASPGPRARPG
jgi:hypothetical protein